MKVFKLMILLYIAGCDLGNDPEKVCLNCDENNEAPEEKLTLVTENDLQIITKRHIDIAMKGNNKHIHSILNHMKPDGSFSDVTYTISGYNKDGEPAIHFSHLHTLARAYNHEDNIYYRDAEIRTQIIKGFKFWFDLNLKHTNWWWDRVGWPFALWKPAILMKDELRQYDRETYNRLIEYLTKVSKPSKHITGGANTTHMYQIALAFACIDGNMELLKEAAEGLKGEITLKQGLEPGIYSDFSFAQHNLYGRQFSMGYAQEFLKTLLFISNVFADTSLDLSRGQVELIDNFILQGVGSMAYKNMLDTSTYGRKNYNTSRAVYFQNYMKKYALLETPKSIDIKRLSERLKLGHSKNNYSSRNKMFHHADFMSHIREHYYTSARPTSVRTVGTESGNGEGLKNYHMGDGVNLIYHHGDEYDDIFPAWDFRKLPGTTVEQKKGALPLVQWGLGAQGGSDYTGGVSDGLYGFIATHYKEGAVEARKSWFFFDDEYIALGADISSNGAHHPVYTSVNQTLLKSDITIKSPDSSEFLVVDQGRYNQLDWVHHYDIGYFILGVSGPVKVVSGRQSGNRKDLNVNYKSENISKSIFNLGFDHGRNKKHGYYAYAVVPGIEKSAMNAYANKKPFFIIENSRNVQAIAHPQLGITMIAFYNPGELRTNTGLSVKVDKPVTLMLKKKQNSLQVFAANPLYTKAKINVEISGKYEGMNTEVLSADGYTKLVFDMADGHKSGSTYSKSLEILDYSPAKSQGEKLAEIYPVKDSHTVGGDFRDKNYGKSRYIPVAKNNNQSYTREAYLAFDLNEDAFENKSAKLRLYNFDHKKAKKAKATLEVYLVNSDWQETALRHNNRPEPKVFGASLVTRDVPGWMEFDVTYLVEKAISQPDFKGQIAFVIKSAELGPGSYRSFYPRESDRPAQLVISENPEVTYSDNYQDILGPVFGKFIGQDQKEDMVLYRPCDGQDCWELYKSRSMKGSFSRHNWHHLIRPTEHTKSFGLHAGDFNGDGSDDLLFLGRCEDKPQLECWHVLMNNNEGDFHYENWGRVPFQVEAGYDYRGVYDIDQDGDSDIIYLDRCSDRPHLLCPFVHYSNRKSFEYFREWGSAVWLGADSKDYGLVLGHFNGKQRPAVAMMWGKCGGDGHGCWRSYRYRSGYLAAPSSQGSDFPTKNYRGYTVKAGLATGDLNGDGSTDMLYLDRGGWRALLSDGYEFMPVQLWDRRFWPSPDWEKYKAHLADVDGDGLSDIIFHGKCGRTARICWRMRPSTGEGFGTAQNKAFDE